MVILYPAIFKQNQWETRSKKVIILSKLNTVCVPRRGFLIWSFYVPFTSPPPNFPFFGVLQGLMGNPQFQLPAESLLAASVLFSSSWSLPSPSFCFLFCCFCLGAACTWWQPGDGVRFPGAGVADRCARNRTRTLWGAGASLVHLSLTERLAGQEAPALPPLFPRRLASRTGHHAWKTS